MIYLEKAVKIKTPDKNISGSNPQLHTDIGKRFRIKYIILQRGITFVGSVGLGETGPDSPETRPKYSGEFG